MDGQSCRKAIVSIGVVVIGRNEGARLGKCLESVIGPDRTVVYVDSGSTDDSVAMARARGVEVLELDMSIPFCAARARNAGFARLMQCDSQVEFVQFVDGDCEIARDWLSTAAQALSGRPELTIVAGWMNERFPEASIYNRIGEVEWNFSGAGEVESVGGVFMVRREVFESVGGFDATVTAGEEPELCLRLRQKGWKILRLDHRMAWHDLAMTRFSQWWTRQVRNGYGSADVGRRFGLPFFQRNNRRVKAWAIWLIALPLVGVGVGIEAGAPAGLLSVLCILAIWPAQVVRVAIRNVYRVNSRFLALAYAFFIMAAYFPQIVGQAKYFADRLRGRSNRLIEYKAVKSTAKRADN
jgi:glycosyltransferase involved in cell wall biosynthesis